MMKVLLTILVILINISCFVHGSNDDKNDRSDSILSSHESQLQSEPKVTNENKLGRLLKFQETMRSLGIENSPLFEGDIIPSYASILRNYGPSTIEKLEAAGFVFDKTKAINVDKRWETRIGDVVQIPYQLESVFTTTADSPNAAFIRRELDDLETKVLYIKFVERTTETDYVSVVDGTGCNSFVGRIGGEQVLNLEIGVCSGLVQHEFLHALGVYHEQSRTDRDEHVQILFENIQEGKEGNFEKQLDSQSLGTDYDYKSVVHYPNNAFSKSAGLLTIQTIPVPFVRIGTATRVSDTDVLQLRLLYQCVSGPRNLTDRTANPCTADCKCAMGETGCGGNNDACQGELECNGDTCSTPVPTMTPTVAPTSPAPSRKTSAGCIALLVLMLVCIVTCIGFPVAAILLIVLLSLDCQY